jgi:hypothetical protein
MGLNTDASWEFCWHSEIAFITKCFQLILYGAEHYSRGRQLWSHSRHSQRFMKPKSSLPHSQEPTTCPYLEPDKSSPHSPHPISLRSILMSSTHIRLGLPSGLFPSAFPTNNLHAFLFSPSVLHDRSISSSLTCSF